METSEHHGQKQGVVSRAVRLGRSSWVELPMIRDGMRLAVEPIANLFKTAPSENQPRLHSSRRKKGFKEFL
jgi:hypothetical protein